jgi:glutamate carboxypeptidase
VFDMKAGAVQGLSALGALAEHSELDGVDLLFAAGQDVGSPARGLVEALASGAVAALVLERSAPGGALKVARKGVDTSWWRAGPLTPGSNRRAASTR